MRPYSRLGITVLIALSFLGLSTHVTQASPSSMSHIATLGQLDQLASDKPGEDKPMHCITGPGKPLECFETEAQALNAASEGKIRLAPGQSAISLPDAVLFSATTTIQATLYEHANYGGSTLTIYSDGCFGWNNMATGWNDRVSSARTGSCGITLYEHYNLTGATLRIDYPGTSYVGDGMNDKASSWSLP